MRSPQSQVAAHVSGADTGWTGQEEVQEKMSFELTHQFADYLRSKNHLAVDSNSLNGTAQSPAQSQDERTLHKLWSLTDLSANDFADEVAGFFKVPRIGLPDLLSAPPLADQFSR